MKKTFFVCVCVCKMSIHFLQGQSSISSIFFLLLPVLSPLSLSLVSKSLSFIMLDRYDRKFRTRNSFPDLFPCPFSSCTGNFYRFYLESKKTCFSFCCKKKPKKKISYSKVIFVVYLSIFRNCTKLKRNLVYV